MKGIEKGYLLFRKYTLMLFALIIRCCVVSGDKTIRYCEVILGPIVSIKSAFLFTYFTETNEIKPDGKCILVSCQLKKVCPNTCSFDLCLQ